jgi:putative nucleotidyltransferase with HDIG domain
MAQLGPDGVEKAIIAVAQLLKRNSRITDLLARFSETGFMLTLAGSDIERALVVAEKFRQLIEQNSGWEHGTLSVSIGVAAYPLQGCDKEELIFLSQQAAKLAKYGGGNQVATLGSDSMKTMAFNALNGILSDRDFETGPEVASNVATQLERVSSDPLFSSLVSQMVESLASAIDAKDHYTKHHSEEASVYAEALARVCQFTDKQIELVRMAAKLHDLGKIGVPEHILQKPGPLDTEEYKIMKEHPSIGARILQPIQSLSELVPIIQCHHERWDGSGYPAGLRGEETPVEARLIGVIDSYHAIISERPYKKAMPILFALNELRRQAGTIFDPILVEKFCHLMETDEILRITGEVHPVFDDLLIEAQIA